MHSRANAFLSVPGRQFQSFLRKFRSQDTVAPACLARRTSSKLDRHAAWLIDGVMPVTCSQCTPASAASNGYSSGSARLIAEPSRSYSTVEPRWLAPASTKYNPRRPWFRHKIGLVSTPRPRSVAARLSDTACRGRAVKYRTLWPNIASDAQTFASPPPQVTSTRPGSDCRHRKCPSGAIRAMISPNAKNMNCSPFEFAEHRSRRKCRLSLRERRQSDSYPSNAAQSRV